MRIVHSDSYKALKKVKDTVLGLALKDFPGKDICALYVQIKQCAEYLECGDHFTEEMIPKICRKHVNAADTEFSQWATTNLYEPALKQVKNLHVMHKSALAYKPLTIDTLCRMTTTCCDDANAAGHYTTAVTTKEPDALPLGYIVKIHKEVVKSLKQVNYADKYGNGKGGGGTGGAGDGSSDTDGDKDLSAISVNEHMEDGCTHWHASHSDPRRVQRYRYCTNCNR